MTVHLYANKDGAEGFREYEKRALDIFKRYGGEVLVAYVPVEAVGDQAPDEIQVLRIPDRARLDAFMNDPERLGMTTERTRVIRKTDVFLSGRLIQY